MDFSFELLSREERCLEISPNQGKGLWRGILDKFNRHFHSIGSHLSSIRSYFYSIGSYLSSIPSYCPSIGSYLSSIRTHFNCFVASYITLVYSSVAFHIYPHLCGNSIPSDCNYHSAVVAIWSAEKPWRRSAEG